MNRNAFTIILIFIIGTMAGDALAEGNRRFYSYKNTKERMIQLIYTEEDKRLSFFCRCPFDGEERLLICDQYDPKRYGYRAKRIEWEHVVPAREFGRTFKAWRKGDSKCYDRKGDNFRGRRCARKMSKTFRRMECDMYNIVPVIGEFNDLRESFPFGVVSGEAREFGRCDMEIDEEKEIAEPPPSVRGDIARTYLYMDWAYHSIFSGRDIVTAENRVIFGKWSETDPVDEMECWRCKKIESVQENENPFVKKPCEDAGMW